MMWILFNWACDDLRDLLPVSGDLDENDNPKEEVKKFASSNEALSWAKENLNFHYKAVEF